MHRFFVDKNQINDGQIVILGDDVKHIKDVLRLKDKDRIELSCSGLTYICEIEQITKKNIITRIVEEYKGKNESTVEVVLFQGLAKGNKMEMIFQKGTEIGIKEFYPVELHRSVVKIKDASKERNKIDRWNTIVEEAAKQSKRDNIPKVNEILSFDRLIELLKDEPNILIPYEGENIYTIKEGLSKFKDGKINLIIGPEGGFEDSEIERLKDIGGNVVTLGNRILRTETAGLVTATIILYELGNIGVI